MHSVVIPRLCVFSLGTLMSTASLSTASRLTLRVACTSGTGTLRGVQV